MYSSLSRRVVLQAMLRATKEVLLVPDVLGTHQGSHVSCYYIVLGTAVAGTVMLSCYYSVLNTRALQQATQVRLRSAVQLQLVL